MVLLPETTQLVSYADCTLEARRGTRHACQPAADEDRWCGQPGQHTAHRHDKPKGTACLRSSLIYGSWWLAVPESGSSVQLVSRYMHGMGYQAYIHVADMYLHCTRALLTAVCGGRTCSTRHCCGRGGWRCRSRSGCQMRRAACRSSRSAAALQHASWSAGASCPAGRHALHLSCILLQRSVMPADPHQQAADEHIHEPGCQSPRARRCGCCQSAQ